MRSGFRRGRGGTELGEKGEEKEDGHLFMARKKSSSWEGDWPL